MSDFAVGLILMLLMFGLPELLRKGKRPQDYEYPVIPDETEKPPAHFEQAAIRSTLIPPLPDSAQASFLQTSEPLAVDEFSSPLSQNLDLRRGMAWHIVLSPPVAMQRFGQKRGCYRESLKPERGTRILTCGEEFVK